MATLVPVSGDPFARSGGGGVPSFDSALAAEGVTGKLADVARSIYQQESGAGANTKTSNAGAVGGMQIIPATFNRVADKGWDIANPEQNMRAGIRYIKSLANLAGGDPSLIAAGYYGGEGAIPKARDGVAISDPRNPGAPNTLQYASQVVSRIPAGGPAAAIQGGTQNEPQLVAVQGDPFKKAAPAAPANGESQSTIGSLATDVVQAHKNVLGGLVRGAGSIGATAMRILPNALGGDNAEENKARRDSIDQFMKDRGVETDSLGYQGGKIGAEIAGTAGAGGVVANVVRAIPGAATAIPSVINAVRTSGMTAGAGGNAISNLTTRAAGGAIAGGASAGLVNPDDAATGAVVGAVLPPVLKGLGGAANLARIAIPGGASSPEVSALAARANQLGIDIPADRLVNSKPLNAIASSLNYMPFSGRAATEKTMESQLNTAASRLVGQNTDNMTKALRDASRDLGSEFDRVLKLTPVKVDTKFLNELASAETLAKRELGNDSLKPILSKIEDVLDKTVNGSIDGQAAYNIKRRLDVIGNRNGPEAYHARELKKSLMDALNRSLGPQEAAAFAKTREQYGNMLALEKIAKNGAEGDISIARLANMKNINNQPLQELADISAQFIKAREGQHGAMQRALVGGASVLHGGPAGIAALAATGRATNMLLNSGTAKNLVLGKNAFKSLANDRLLQAGYRAAPALSADR